MDCVTLNMKLLNLAWWWQFGYTLNFKAILIFLLNKKSWWTIPLVFLSHLKDYVTNFTILFPFQGSQCFSLPWILSHLQHLVDATFLHRRSCDRRGRMPHSLRLRLVKQCPQHAENFELWRWRFGREWRLRELDILLGSMESFKERSNY